MFFNNPAFGESEEVYYFSGSTPGTFNTGWQNWTKPPGTKYISILCIGAGASGGGGLSGTTTSAGGAGGGGGAAMSVLYPSKYIPDVLHIQTAVATPAVGTDTVGNQGGSSYVCIEPNITTVGHRLAFARGGYANTNFAAATTLAEVPLAAQGHYTFYVGARGIASAVTPLPNDVFNASGGPSLCGAGGGGVSGAASGSSVSIVIPGNPNYFVIPGGAGLTTIGTATAGSSGPVLWKPEIFGGGAGGGGHSLADATSFGGNGGNGSPGCGGGGGGGARTAGNGGGSGRGGPGVVIIRCF